MYICFVREHKALTCITNENYWKMKLFAQYKGLKRENYILFFGRIVTNLGAMIWPLMTMILNKKLGLNATDTAMFSIISGIFSLEFDVIKIDKSILWNVEKVWDAKSWLRVLRLRSR